VRALEHNAPAEDGSNHDPVPVTLPAGARNEAARVLAGAFRDNPLNRAVIRKRARRRLRSNYCGMRSMLSSAEGRALVWALPGVRGGPGPSETGIRGVLVGIAPGDYPLPPRSIPDQIRCLWGQGPATLGRWAVVYRVLEEVHPLEPHWYLGVLGIDSEQQGRGLGSAMLRHFAERVDRDAAPAYLETDRAENVAFYGRVGFDVALEIQVLGVKVWCMKRPARDETRSVSVEQQREP